MSVLNKVNVISSLQYDCKICQKIDYRRQDSVAGVFSNYAHSWLTCGADLFVVNNSNGILQSHWTFGENIQDDLEITCAAELAIEGCTIPLLILGISSENKNFICFFNPNTRKILRTIDIIYPVRTLCVIEDGTNEVNPINNALSPTEGLIAVGCAEGTILLIDLCRSILCKAINGDFRFYSNEENPSNAVHIEVDSVTSSDFQQLIFESRKKNDSVSVILTDPSDEGITALLYSVEAAILFVGTSSGSFQMWNLSSLSCLFKSPATRRAIISLSLLEPCDDPRHSLYLWICFDEYAQVAMYSILFSSKFFAEGYGVYYQNFESAGLAYRFTLGMEVDVLAKRPISTQAVAKLVPKNLVRCISLPEAEETQLRLFVTAYEIVDKGQISVRAIIFDLNQWYRDQMPEEGISSCLDSIDLDSKSLWHLQLDPSSLTLYQCVRPQEQHFHPTSYDFQVWCIEEEGIRCLEKLGLQTQWLKNMSRMGSKALLEPTRVFHGALAAGLLPLFIDPPDPEVNNQVQERSYVLTVCLENRAISVIEDCAKEWNNGSHTVRGCTIQYLLDWLWTLHKTYKSNGNKIGVPLFDQSGMKFDISEKRSLQHCKSLLNTVQSIFTNIVHKYSNILISGVQEKLTAMSLVKLYFDCCLKLIAMNLLPEPNELGKPSESITYAYSTIKTFVNNRRKEGPFLGDSFFGKTDAEIQWQEEGGTAHYPPPSIQSVLRFCLHPSPSVANKMSLLLYLYMDILDSYSPIRSKPVLEKVKKFQHLMRISEVQYKIVAGCWYLDHSIFEEGIDLLFDPRVLSVDLREDQHRGILQLLASKGQEKLALQYLRLKSPSLHLEEDLRLELNLLLSNHLVNEAFSFQRKHPEIRETLLIEFFKGCIERKQLGQVFGLNLDVKEVSVLMKYLKSSGLKEKGDLQVLLLLSKAKYTEAMYLNDRLNSTINGPKSRIGTDTRDMIVKGITGSLNSISRHMAHEMKTYRPPPAGLQPQPLSTLIKVCNGPDGPLCQTDNNVLLSAVVKSTRHLSDFVNSFESGHRRKREEDLDIDFEEAPSRKRPKLWDTTNGFSRLPSDNRNLLFFPNKPSTPQDRDVMELVGTPLVKKRGKRSSPQSRPSSILKGKTPEKITITDELGETPKKSIRFTLPDNDIQISARKPLHENEIPAGKTLKVVMESQNLNSTSNFEKTPKTKHLRKLATGRKPLHGDDITNTSPVIENIRDRLRSSAKKKLLEDGINWDEIVQASKPRLLFSQGVSKNEPVIKPTSTPPSSTPLSQVLLDITVTSAEKKYLDSPSRGDENSPVTEALFDTTVLPKTLFTFGKNEKESKGQTEESSSQKAFLERYKKMRNKPNEVKNMEKLIAINDIKLGTDFAITKKNEDIGFNTINIIKNEFQQEEKTFKEMYEHSKTEEMSKLTSCKLVLHESKKVNDQEGLTNEGISQEGSLLDEDELKRDKTVTKHAKFLQKLPEYEVGLTVQFSQDREESEDELLPNDEEDEGLQKDTSHNEESSENKESSVLENYEFSNDGEDQTLLEDQEDTTWSGLKLNLIKGNVSVMKSHDSYIEKKGYKKVNETVLYAENVDKQKECSKNNIICTEVSVSREEIISEKDLEDKEQVTKSLENSIKQKVVTKSLVDVEKTSTAEDLPIGFVNEVIIEEVIDIASDDDDNDEEEEGDNDSDTDVEEEEEVEEEEKLFDDKQMTDEEETEEVSEEDSVEEEIDEEASDKEEESDVNEGLLPDVSSVSEQSDQGEVENSDDSSSSDGCQSLLGKYKTEIEQKEKNIKQSSVVILLDDSDDEVPNKEKNSESKDFIEDTESESKMSLQGVQYNEDVSDTEIFGLKNDQKNIRLEENSEDDIWAGLDSNVIDKKNLEKEKLDDECIVDCLEVECSQELELRCDLGNEVTELVEIKGEDTKLVHSKPELLSVTNQTNFIGVKVEKTNIEIKNVQSIEKYDVSKSDCNIENVDSHGAENGVSASVSKVEGVIDDVSVTIKVDQQEIMMDSEMILGVSKVTEKPFSAECEASCEKFPLELPISGTVSSISEEEIFVENIKASESVPLNDDACQEFNNEKLFVSKPSGDSEMVLDLKEDFQSIERNWTLQIEKEMKQDNVLLKSIESTSDVSTDVRIVPLLDDNNITSHGDLNATNSSTNQCVDNMAQESGAVNLIHTVQLDDVGDNQMGPKKSNKPLESSELEGVKDTSMKCIVSSLEDKSVTNPENNMQPVMCKLITKEKFTSDIKNLGAKEISQNTQNISEDLINDGVRKLVTSGKSHEEVIGCFKADSEVTEVFNISQISNVTPETFERSLGKNEEISEIHENDKRTDKVIGVNEIIEVKINPQHMCESSDVALVPKIVQHSVTDTTGEYSEVTFDSVKDNKQASVIPMTVISQNFVMEHTLETLIKKTPNKDQSKCYIIRDPEMANTELKTCLLQTNTPVVDSEGSKLDLVCDKGENVELTVIDQQEHGLGWQKPERRVKNSPEICFEPVSSSNEAVSVNNPSELCNVNSETCSFESVTKTMNHHILPAPESSVNLLHTNQKDHFKDNDIVSEETMVTEKEVVNPGNKASEVVTDNNVGSLKTKDEEQIKMKNSEHNSTEISDQTVDSENKESESEKIASILSKPSELHLEKSANKNSPLHRTLDSSVRVNVVEINRKEHSNEQSSNDNITEEIVGAPEEKSNDTVLLPFKTSEPNFKKNENFDESVAKEINDCSTVEASKAINQISNIGCQSGDKIDSISSERKLPKYITESITKQSGSIHLTLDNEASEDVLQDIPKESTVADVEMSSKDIEQSVPGIYDTQKIIVGVECKTVVTEVPSLKCTGNHSEKLVTEETTGDHETVVEISDCLADNVSGKSKFGSFMESRESVKMTVSSEEQVAGTGINKVSTDTVCAVEGSELNYDNSSDHKSYILQTETKLCSSSKIIDKTMEINTVIIGQTPQVTRVLKNTSEDRIDECETSSIVEETCSKSKAVNVQAICENSEIALFDVSISSKDKKYQSVESNQENVSVCVDKYIDSDSEPSDSELNNAKMDISNESSTSGIFISQGQEGNIEDNPMERKETESDSETCSKVTKQIPLEKSFFFGKEDIDTYIRSTKATFQIGSRVSLADEDEPVNPMEIAMYENEGKSPGLISPSSPDIHLSLRLSPERFEKPKKVDQGMVTQNSYLQRRARRSSKNSEKSVKPSAVDCDKKIKSNVNLQPGDDSSHIHNVERELRCISTQTSDSILEPLELSESEEEVTSIKNRPSKLSSSSQMSDNLKVKDRRKMRQSSEPPGMHKDIDRKHSVGRRNSTKACGIESKQDLFTEVDVKGILKNKESYQHKKINVDNLEISGGSDSNMMENQRSSNLKETKTQLEADIPTPIRRSRRLSEQYSETSDHLTQKINEHRRRSRGYSEDPDVYRISSYKEKGRKSYHIPEKTTVIEGVKNIRRSRRRSEEPEVVGILKNVEKVRNRRNSGSTNFDQISSDFQSIKKSRRCSEEIEMQYNLNKNNKQNQRSSYKSETFKESKLHQEDDFPQESRRLRRHSEEPEIQGILKKRSRESRSSHNFETNIEEDFPVDIRKLRRCSEESETQGNPKPRSSKGNRKGSSISETCGELGIHHENKESRKVNKNVEHTEIYSILKKHNKEHRRHSHSSETDELKLRDEVGFVEGNRKLRRHSEEPEMLGTLNKGSRRTRRSSHSSEIPDELKLYHQEILPEGGRQLRRHSEEPQLQGILKKRSKNSYSSDASEPFHELKLRLEEDFPEERQTLMLHSEEPEVQRHLKKNSTDCRKGSHMSETADGPISDEHRKLRTCIQESDVKGIPKKRSASCMKSSHASGMGSNLQPCQEDHFAEEKDNHSNDADLQLLPSKTGKRGFYSSTSDTTGHIEKSIDEGFNEESRKSARRLGESKQHCSLTKECLEKEHNSFQISPPTDCEKDQKEISSKKNSVSVIDVKGKEIKHSRKSLLISKYKDDIEYRNDREGKLKISDNFDNREKIKIIDKSENILYQKISSQGTDESTFENKRSEGSHTQELKKGSHYNTLDTVGYKVKNLNTVEEEDFEEISPEVVKKFNSAVVNREESMEVVPLESENKGSRKSRKKTPDKKNANAKNIDERKRKMESEHLPFLPKRLEYSDDESPDKKKPRSLIDFPIKRNSRLPRPTLEDIEEEEDEPKKKKQSVDDLHLEKMKKKSTITKKSHVAKLVIEESDDEPDVSTPELWKKKISKEKRLTRTQQKLFLLNQQLTSVSDITTSSVTSSSSRRSTRKKVDVVDSPSKTPTRSSLRLQKKPPSEAD